MILPKKDTYEEVQASFSWQVPTHYNAAFDVCDRHVERNNPALIFDTDQGMQSHSFAELQSAACRFANLLTSLGLTKGDVVAIVAQPAFAVAITHVGAWKAGIVTSPLATLFAAEALIYRFETGRARIVVTDAENEERVRAAAARCSSIEHVLVFDRNMQFGGSFWSALANMDDRFENVDTRADDPASLNFTSGTTGQPKGVLAPHSHVLGQGAAMEFLCDFPEPGDVMWSPADWAWLAGQMCTLAAGLFMGMTVVARPRAGFDAADAYRILAQYGITHTLLIPTMLKLMRQVPIEEQRRGEMNVRVVTTGGEPCGAELYRWVRETFDAPLNETFGQTECATMICNNQSRMSAPFGCLGKPTPGMVAAIVGPDGRELAAGEIGEIAARMPHPIIFQQYLGNPEATAAKKVGDWMLTGDLGRRDADGYFWYVGRADDVITSSGYRIGPSEVEDALLAHPAVAIAAVIGLPDPERTELVSAYIKLSTDYVESDELKEELKDFVRDHLARHEIPRRIEFVGSLPITSTGKVMRKALREQVLAAKGMQA
ncbi:MAG: AMP-binding protein [Rhizobiaceae bacterium]|nr:AMP-binding protein [Rhizobiaceae bacterium]